MNKVFCPTCGELEIVDGVVYHPAMDMIIFNMLNNGFKINYTPIL